jgi:hypothetical protein
MSSGEIFSFFLIFSISISRPAHFVQKKISDLEHTIIEVEGNSSFTGELEYQV